MGIINSLFSRDPQIWIVTANGHDCLALKSREEAESWCREHETEKIKTSFHPASVEVYPKQSEEDAVRDELVVLNADLTSGLKFLEDQNSEPSSRVELV